MCRNFWEAFKNARESAPVSQKIAFFTFTEAAEEFACVRSRRLHGRVRISFRSANAMLMQRNNATRNQTRKQSRASLISAIARDRSLPALFANVLTTISRVINFRDLARANRRDCDELLRTMRDNGRYCYEIRRWWIRILRTSCETNAGL